MTLNYFQIFAMDKGKKEKKIKKNLSEGIKREWLIGCYKDSFAVPKPKTDARWKALFVFYLCIFVY